MNSERRHEVRVRHPRIAATCTPLEWTFPRGASNVARTLLDVSTGGARLVVNKPLETGEPVTLRLSGLHNNRSVTISCEVRWLVPLPTIEGGTLAYVTGLRFRPAPGLLQLLATA